MYHLFTVFINSFFWCIPMHEEKLFVHTFHGIISIFLKTPTLFFFIFFRYHFHWYSIHYGNCLRWGSQQLDMNVSNKLNNSMYLCQNIIRADSENFFQWRGKGLQTLISRTQKLFAANYFLTTPPKLPPPALLAVTQIFHYQQNQQMSVELICDPVMDGEKPPFATEWPPSPLKNHGHNSAYCYQVSRPNKEGEGSAKNRAETMGKYSTDSEENWFSDTRSKRNSIQLCL